MPELFTTVMAAMRERASATEVIAARERGLLTQGEVLSVAWQACHDPPDLQVELIRQFRAHADEDIVDVGDGLADLAAQSAARQAIRRRDMGD